MKKIISIFLAVTMTVSFVNIIFAAEGVESYTAVFEETFEKGFAAAPKDAQTTFGGWKYGTRNSWNPANAQYRVTTSSEAGIANGEYASGSILEVKALTIGSADQQPTAAENPAVKVDSNARSEAIVAHIGDAGYEKNIRITADIYAKDFFKNGSGGSRDDLQISLANVYNYDNANNAGGTNPTYVYMNGGNVGVNAVPNSTNRVAGYQQSAWNHVVIDIDGNGEVSVTVNGEGGKSGVTLANAFTDLVIYVPYNHGGWWFIDNIKVEHDFTEELQSVVEELTWDSIKNANTSELTAVSNLILPSKLSGGSYHITWSSDNTSVIANDGTVTRDYDDYIVTLRALIQHSDVAEASITKEFEINVPAVEYEFYGYKEKSYEDKPFETILKDDFELGEVGELPSGWAMWSNSGAAAYQLAEDPIDEQNQVFKIARDSVTFTTRAFMTMTPTITESTEVSFRFYVGEKTSAETADTLDVLLRGVPASSASEGTLYSSVRLRNGQVDSVQNVYRTSCWNTARLSIDMTKDAPVVSVYVNDEFVLNKTLDKTAKQEGIGKVVFDAPNSASTLGTAYVDDFMVQRDHGAELREAADSLTLDDVWNADEVTQNINLPQTAGSNGYTVVWSSENEDAVTAEGIVTRRSFTQKTTLNAKIMISDDVYINKQFALTVMKEECGDIQQILEEYADKILTFSNLSNEPPDAVTKKITMPTAGPDGITISWTSSNDSIVSNKGVVMRPLYSDGDTNVRLTAILEKDGVSREVIFDVKVLKLENPADAINAARAYVEKQLSEQGISVDKALSGEGCDITRGIVLPIAYENGTTVTWRSDNESALSVSGEVNRGEETQPVSLYAEFYYGGEMKTVIYKFNVLLKESAMAQKDVEAVVIDNSDALTDNFSMPKAGAFYDSLLSWTSDSPLITVRELSEEYRFTVNRPEAESEIDTTVILTVTASQGNAVISKQISVSVVKLKSSSEIIAEACDALTFDVIKAGNTAENNITQNLALPKTMDNGVTVSWTCDMPEIINQNGEVFCPVPGSAAQEVILTASISRGAYAAAMEKNFNLTVIPYSDSQEVLDKIKNSLTFDCLSTEAIDCVTQDLILPAEWYYGSKIEWKSDSTYVMINDGAGAINRPAYGSGSVSAVLTASIYYGDEILSKSFALTIPEIDYLEGSENVWSENCENWVLGTVEFTGTGTWDMPVTNGVNDGTFIAVKDPNDPNNTVVKMDAGSPSNASTSGYLKYTYTNALSGTVIVGMRCYISNSGSLVTITARTASSNAATVNFSNGEIKSSSFYSDPEEKKNATFQYIGAEYPIGEWFDLRFEANTERKKFHLFINDECISDDGKVVYQDTNTGMKDYEAFDSSQGIPYTYYASSERPTAIQAINFTMWKGSGGADTSTAVYLDDFYIDKRVTYTQDQLAAAALYESAFMSKNNISNLMTNLIIPTVEYNKIKISAKSSNTSVLTDKGVITRADAPQNVEWIVSFDDGNSIYQKSFLITVAGAVSAEVTDAEAVILDAEGAISRLRESYLLNALESNLVLPAVGTYGSQLSYISSDPTVISNAGIISRGESNKSAVITVTAVKKGESAQRTVSVTVLKKAVSQSTGSTIVSGAGSGSSSGGGSKPYLGGTAAASANDPADTKVEVKDKFSDVPSAYWAYDAINYLAEKEIVAGSGEGAFEPERSVNREEFVKMLIEALNIPLTQGKTEFTDVDGGAWYEDYITTAVKEGFVNGNGDGSFGVGMKISRQDLAVMIYRAAGLLPESKYTAFEDDAQIADYAKDAVYTLKAYEIISGKSADDFDPSAETTRAEASAMLYRAMKNNLFD